MSTIDQLQSIFQTLSTSTDEQEAYNMLKDLKVSELKEIASIATIFVRNMNKQEMINKIIRSTITARKRGIGIQNRKEA